MGRHGATCGRGAVSEGKGSEGNAGEARGSRATETLGGRGKTVLEAAGVWSRGLT